MTQETADRIFELMRDIRLWDAEHDALDHRAVARQIAAEIDTLAAKVKECDDNTDFVEGLREAERAALADTRQSLAVATVKIDALTRERDEAQKGWEHYQARAEIAEGERDRYARDAALMCAVWNSYRDLLPGVRAELTEARAEVERLRLPAEAWEAWDALQDAIRSGTANQIGRHEAWYRAAAARARAAKESQP